MQAFLHFGFASDPRQTVKVELRERPLWFHASGLIQTASGYGRKLVTPYEVKLRNRWRRVYSCCISNVSTEYIGAPGAWEATVSLVPDYD